MDITPFNEKASVAYYANPTISVATMQAEPSVAHYANQFGLDMQPAGVPPGLELLVELDELQVHEHNKFWDLLPGVRSARNYSINNNAGQLCYIVEPEIKCCDALDCCLGPECYGPECCAPHRDFDMYVLDRNKQYGIVNAYREIPWCVTRCTAEEAARTLHVEAPAGVSIGSIKFVDACCGAPSKFLIRDAAGKTQLVAVYRDTCCQCDGTKLKMEIRSANEVTRVGTMKKKNPGCYKDFCFSASDYTINFPKDLDAKVKAILLTAAFFSDLIYYRKRIVKPVKI